MLRDVNGSTLQNVFSDIIDIIDIIHIIEMNKNRNTNNIEIILNTNKAQFILDELSICSAVGNEININLSSHLYFQNKLNLDYMKKC